jgi:hypothetical protein
MNRLTLFLILSLFGISGFIAALLTLRLLA